MNDLRSQARRELAVAIHAAAVAGVDPRDATRRAVAARIEGAKPPFWIIALGKASSAMAEAAVHVLGSHGVEPDGGVIVAPEPRRVAGHTFHRRSRRSSGTRCRLA